MELYVDIKKRLRNFELNVKFNASKDILGILGASGSGKSMAIRCIAGLETPDSGKIVLNDRVLYDSQKKVDLLSRKRRTGFLFQNYALFPHLNIEQNIEFALGHLSVLERSKIVAEKIDMMRLKGFEKRYPNQLSGGQQQRVALARVLAVDPEVLLLDEPFSALDDHLRSQMVKQLIESLSEYNGVTLFVTHNMEEAYRICKDIMFLSDGKKEAYGEKAEIFLRPPTLYTAQLTGCKNISRARRLGTNIIEAEEWGCKLETNEDVHNISHVGIRAHYITMADEKMDKNIFSCLPVYTSETPFRMTVYLSIEKPALGMKDYHVQWEISKEKWEEVKNKPLPWKMQLKPDKLILMRN